MVVVKWMSPCLVVLRGSAGTHVWDVVKSRKSHRCEVCSKRTGKGAEVWRPLSNGYNRMLRMCRGCLVAPLPPPAKQE